MATVKKSSTMSLSKLIFFVCCFALVASFAIFALEKFHVIDLYQKAPINTTVVTTDSSTQNPPQDSTTSTDTPATTPATTPPSNDQKNPNTNSSTTLIAPNGNFVSNHSPNLSGQPAPNSIVSACSTTPGASCYITFTKGSNVITLKSQTTDANGNTSWSWNLQDNQFTVGDWQITAYATLAGKTLSTTDPVPLKVAQ